MGLTDWWNRLKKKALKESTRMAAEKVADSALDDLESALLGEVGAADEILEGQTNIDPLDRIRAAHGLETDAPTTEKPSDPVADAQAQLEKLKAERAKK